MTRTPIPSCPQPETPIRDRALTDEQRHAMTKYTADEVRTRFETWTSAQPWFKATIGFGRSGDEYADPCINSRWQGWWAAYAERIAADEVVVTDEVVQKFADELDELFAVEDAQEPAFLNDVRRIQTSVWPHPPAQAAQVDKPPRLGGCCCGEPCTLGVVHRTDGPCFHYVEPTAEPVAQGEFDAEARSHARMIHDFPRLSAFFQKHALGSKLPASCFACGHVGERAITHAELADIYVCKTCAERIAKSPAQSAEVMIDFAGKGGAGPFRITDGKITLPQVTLDDLRDLIAQPAERDEMSPDFTDSARAAITWVLYHHQGNSSPIGQPLRFALGMDGHERLQDWRIAEAKRWAEHYGATTEQFHRQPAERMVEESELVEIARRVGLRGTMHAVSTRDAGSILRTFVEHVLAATQQADR